MCDRPLQLIYPPAPQTMPAIAVEAGQSVVIARPGSFPEQLIIGVEVISALPDEPGN